MATRDNFDDHLWPEPRGCQLKSGPHPMTHDEKIVEAVARAIADAEGDDFYEGRSFFEKAARAAITAYQAEAWQPIETAPRDGREIWVYGGRHENPHLTDADGEWWNSTLCPGSSRPTHWMPTPSAPNPPASP